MESKYSKQLSKGIELLNCINEIAIDLAEHVLSLPPTVCRYGNQACFKPAAKFHPSLYAAITFVQTKLENCSVEVHTTSLTFFQR